MIVHDQVHRRQAPRSRLLQTTTISGNFSHLYTFGESSDYLLHFISRKVYSPGYHSFSKTAHLWRTGEFRSPRFPTIQKYDIIEILVMKNWKLGMHIVERDRETTKYA
ncbi:hypothetical protein WG66_016276 [Moniliophthora roreri]|nr:hypothetical protein WG66_016276 [Moniliophthora roreri]